LRFVATRSAAATLRMKSCESGAGRFSDFVLPLLTFAEYLDFCDQAHLVQDIAPPDAGRPQYHAPNIATLNAEFISYLNYGGFPEAVMNPSVRQDPRRYLRQDIVDKVLQKDLPSLFAFRTRRS
jgi:predicted AAA+ superfamily ATPase